MFQMGNVLYLTKDIFNVRGEKPNIKPPGSIHTKDFTTNTVRFKI